MPSTAPDGDRAGSDGAGADQVASDGAVGGDGLGGGSEGGADQGARGAGRAAGTARGQRRRGRRAVRTAVLVLAAVCAVAAVSVAATGAFGGDDDTSGAGAPSGPDKTATVRRTTLTRGETVSGTLGYGKPEPVHATPASAAAGTGTGGGAATGAGSGSGQGGSAKPASAAGTAATGDGDQGGDQQGTAPATTGSAADTAGTTDPATTAATAVTTATFATAATGESAGGADDGGGIVTWLPDAGQTVERGEAVYGVDGYRVPLLYGEAPLYRTLEPGRTGADVKLLESNLAALGYTGFTVDEEYTDGTAEAVRDWQENLGRERTGRVGAGDAVVAAGARRVAEVPTTPGALATGELLSWTSTERRVTVDLDVQFEDLVSVGARATVALPDGTRAKATVAHVGTAATPAPAASGQGSGGGAGGSDAKDATLPVELTVDDAKKLGRYQAAPVDVTLEAESRKDVLAVPVEALVAREGGGYAVQAVAADGRVTHRPVRLGMFADGLVEISGTGIEEGTAVGVPR